MFGVGRGMGCRQWADCVQGYDVVSREWLRVVLGTWPELAPEKLGEGKEKK